MKTLVIIILVIMAWKGHAICSEFEPRSQRQTHETPHWLEEWHQEFEEEERRKEAEINRRLHQQDPRLDEGRDGLA